MTNAVIIQLGVLSAAVLMCVLILYKRRQMRAHEPVTPSLIRPAVQTSQTRQTRPLPVASARKPPERERQVPRAIAIPSEPANAPVSIARSVAAPAVTESVVRVDLDGALGTGEDRNEQILAGISKNIQKTLQMRPVPQHSPIPYSELKPRNTEYVRVKKDIITPHGHIRFSILQDWISTNMLAVFRRASLEWKTPDDLIAFLPSYLEGEAEILNGEVLLIGTPGHNEKLAVPIRRIAAASVLRHCFDFVTDGGTAVNTPAVLLGSDTEFNVVSRGVIAEPVFMNAIERDQAEVHLLIERSTEALTV